LLSVTLLLKLSIVASPEEMMMSQSKISVRKIFERAAICTAFVAGLGAAASKPASSTHNNCMGTAISGLGAAYILRCAKDA